MELLKPLLKYVHTLVHSAFLYIAIAYFPDRNWMPWLLALPYAFFAYITFPGLKPKFEEALVWFFGIPLITAVSGFWALKANGMPDDPAVLVLIYAVFATYIFANLIAFCARVVPELITAPESRHAFRRQPIGFPMLLLLVFVTLLTFIEAL